MSDIHVVEIMEDIKSLSSHIKKYSPGAFPAFFLQLSTVLKLQDILDMQLNDIYCWDGGMVKILSEIIYNGEKIRMTSESRRQLAWYAMQRIPVCQTKEEILDDWLCVNKQGHMLQIQAYRKMLERSCAELGFRQIYNAGTLHSLYGYLSIAYGVKTVAEVAREYKVTRYYLLNRIFRGMEIQYFDHVINQVANIEETEL